jgi:hypothetical protein
MNFKTYTFRLVIKDETGQPMSLLVSEKFNPDHFTFLQTYEYDGNPITVEDIPIEQFNEGYMLYTWFCSYQKMVTNIVEHTIFPRNGEYELSSAAFSVKNIQKNPFIKWLGLIVSPDAQWLLDHLDDPFKAAKAEDGSESWMGLTHTKIIPIYIKLEYFKIIFKKSFVYNCIVFFYQACAYCYEKPEYEKIVRWFLKFKLSMMEQEWLIATKRMNRRMVYLLTPYEYQVSFKMAAEMGKLSLAKDILNAAITQRDPGTRPMQVDIPSLIEKVNSRDHAPEIKAAMVEWLSSLVSVLPPYDPALDPPSRSSKDVEKWYDDQKSKALEWINKGKLVHKAEQAKLAWRARCLAAARAKQAAASDKSTTDKADGSSEK